MRFNKIDVDHVELSGKTAMISTKPRPPQNYYLFWIDHIVGKSSLKCRTQVFFFLYYRRNVQDKWPFCNLQCRRFLWARNLLAKAPYFFLLSPSPLSFFRSRTYCKEYYFYSPQSSTVIKSKMAATTILRTRIRFRPPKIRLHCRLRLFGSMIRT